MHNPLSVPAALLLAACIMGCAGPSLQQRRLDAKQALDALRAGQFEAAEKHCTQIMARDNKNPFARVVRAVTSYKKAMHQLSMDVRTVIFGGMAARGFNHRYMRSSMEQTESALAGVEADLAAANHPGIHVDLCLACWEVDWNRNGQIDDQDRWLFQIEIDRQGQQIAEDDPRRRPTFRYDHGDLLWARAFVAFQRATLNLVLAYSWSEIDKLFQLILHGHPTIVLRMTRPHLVAEARRLILQGLDLADGARRSYLAETDDEREWIPNPRQRDHPMPLPVDQTLYDTWEVMLGDLKRLISGEEGLSVAATAQLGDHQWDNPPQGFVDIGRMLARPKDIVLNLRELMDLQDSRDVEGLLRSVLGEYYVTRMKPSPITRRLSRMKSEIERGEETLERKLRYLIWLN